MPPEYASMRPGPSFAKAIGMQCVFSFGNRSVPNAKIVALSEINLAFGLKNGPAHGELAPHRQATRMAGRSAVRLRCGRTRRSGF